MALAARTASDFSTPRRLWSAIDHGEIEEIQTILANEPLVNFTDKHGVTPLMRAACYDRVDVIKTLLSSGADVNSVRADGFTPLLLAIFYGNAGIVRLLCERGADSNVRTRFGTSAQMWAIARGFYEIADYLERGDTEPQPRVQENTVPAVRSVEMVQAVSEDSDTACEQVETTPDINVIDPDTENTGHSIRVTTSNQESAPLKEPLVVRKLKEPPEIWELVPPNKTHFQSGSANKIKPSVLKLAEQTEPLAARTLKEPPDIWDLVHENNSHFNPGSAFIARITSAKATTLLLLASMVVGALGAFGWFHWKPIGNNAPLPSEVFKSTNGRPLSEPNQSATASAASTAVSAQAEKSQAVSGNTTNPNVSSQDNNGATSVSVGPSSAAGFRRMSFGRSNEQRVKPPDAGTRADIPVAENAQRKPTQPPETTTSASRVAPSATDVKGSTNSGNSQLIERPTGNPAPKRKIIQWP